MSNDLTPFNGTVPMQAAMQAAMRERDAERKYMLPASAKNISDLFSSDVSVNKLAARWRQYVKECTAQFFEGLQNVEALSMDFVSWWANRDSDIAVRINDRALLADVSLYIAKQVIDYKYDTNAFFDPEIRDHVHRWKQLQAGRESLHEAINRTLKLYNREHFCALCDERWAQLRRDMEAAVTTVFETIFKRTGR